MNTSQPIVLIGPAYPLRGGIAHFNESFARALIEEGYKVEIVSFYLQYPAILFPGKSQWHHSNACSDLTIHNWISSINPLSWLRAAKRIAALNPQFVAIRFWIPFMGPALGSIAKRLSRNKILVIGLIDNAIPHEVGIMDKPLSRLFFKHCAGFFTLSRSVANDLKELEPTKPCATSPHPIYDNFGLATPMAQARKNLNLSMDDKVILFFGFIRPYKGLDILLQALGHRDVKGLNLKLVVAGEFYEKREKYDQLIAQLGLEKNVRIYSEYIPDKEVKHYFCAANLVAQPYITATQSGVTQIAYHFERPMLVSNVGGLPEIVPDGKVGLVVEPNPEAIALGLIRFFSEGLEKRFAQETAVEKDRFSWTRFSHTFVSFASKLNEL